MSDFYDITHDGVRMVLPRVTSILKVLDKSNPLMAWATKLERESFRRALEEALTEPGVTFDAHAIWTKMDAHLKGARAWVKANREATDIGSAAHTIIQWHTRRLLGESDLGPEPAGPDAAMRAVVAWMDWAREVEFTPLYTERLVYCPSCAFAGTTDAVAKVQGAVTSIDYKTGKAVYREAHLQVAMYRHGLAREGIATDGGLILRLPKAATDPEFEAVPAVPIQMAAFRAICGTWRTVRWLDQDDTGSARMRPCEVDAASPTVGRTP